MNRMLALVLALPIAGCASAPMEPEAWPAGIPSRSYYEKSYASDESNKTAQEFSQYLTWVFRFYHGYSIAEGWKKSEAKLLDGVAPLENVMLQPKLTYLGMLMSSE